MGRSATGRGPLSGAAGTKAERAPVGPQTVICSVVGHEGQGSGVTERDGSWAGQGTGQMQPPSVLVQ